VGDQPTAETLIGRYEIIRELGQGGMGKVLLARDTVLGRLVALKLLRSDLGLPPESRAALFDRMRHEARAAAALAHPNMVTLHDMGEDAERGLYLVFEFVEGPTLRDRIEEGPLEIAKVGEFARLLGDALTHAHEAGVIHRDVKPENVLLSRFGPKLADFGIARLPDSTLTTSGTILGTPAYSAPEALARGEFSAQSDQFSLAAMLYEAASGQRAFPGDDTLVIAGRIATEAPPLLAPLLAERARAKAAREGAVTGTLIDARALARLDGVLQRGLAKDPGARFPSCREFGEAALLALRPGSGAAAGSGSLSFFPLPSLRAPSASLRPTPTSRISLGLLPKTTQRLHNLMAAGGVLAIALLLMYGRDRGEGERTGASFHAVAQDFSQTIHASAHAAPIPAASPAAHNSAAAAGTTSAPTRGRDAGSDAAAAAVGAAGTEVDAAAPRPAADGGVSPPAALE
jgi:serine/threonine-protein kinase